MNLEEILLTPLSRIETNGGDVLHAIKRNDLGYAGFGEAYFSWVCAGAVKAWKRHKRMTMNLIVPVGQVRFVFRGAGAGTPDAFRIEEIGVNRYTRITVPPGLWFGFQGLGTPQSLVLNIANMQHDPREEERLPLPAIEYDWR